MTQPSSRSARPDASVIEQAFRDFPEHLYRDRSAVHVEIGPDIAYAVCFSTEPNFNYVHGGHFGPDAPERVAQTVRRFRDWNLPFVWFLSPEAVEANLGELLEGHGITKIGDYPIMTLDLSTIDERDAAVDGLVIERVTTEQDLRDWARVSQECFHLDPHAMDRLVDIMHESALDPASRAHLYLGRLNGEAVGTALDVYGEEIVGVWCIGTAAHVRGRGIGAAMTTWPLLAARDAGYAAAMLGATEMGLPVYKRLGWESRYSTPIYARLSWDDAP